MDELELNLAALKSPTLAAPAPSAVLDKTPQVKTLRQHGSNVERQSFTPIAGRAARDAPIAVLSRISHITNIERVLRELPPTRKIELLVPPGVNTKRYTIYKELVEEDPDRYAIVTLDAPGVEPDDSLDDRLCGYLSVIAADPRTNDLRLAGSPIWPILEPALAALIRQRLPLARRLIAALDARLHDNPPAALIVSPDRGGYFRLACTLARRAGIPSVFAQAVLFGRSPRLRPPQADYMTVIDEFTQTLFHDRFGTAHERLPVTGIPRFDLILDRRDQAPMRQVNDAPGRRLVSLMLQRFSHEETEELIRLVAAAAAPFPDVDLAVRLHPAEPASSRARYERFLESLDPSHRFYLSSGDLYDLILNSDVVVGVFSNVLIESAMFGRPVLSINLTGVPLPWPVVERGIAVGAESPDEVRDRLRRLLFDEAFATEARKHQESFLAANPQLREGRAGRRIAELIENLATRTSKVRAGDDRRLLNVP